MNHNNEWKTSSSEEQRTEYRIITYRTYIADRYLQFKTTKTVRNFPDFWNKHEKEEWRFIPEPERYILGYHGVRSCPKKLNHFLGDEGNYVSSFHGQEGYGRMGGVTWLPSTYPNIQDYFNNMNSRYEAFKEEERKNRTTKTTYL